MLLSEFINLKEKPGCNMTEEGRACAVHGLTECPGYKMIETSVQDKLHQRHQEIRKKSGLPNPNYYKELKKTFDLPDEKRYAAVAALKKKYKVEHVGEDAIDDRLAAQYSTPQAKAKTQAIDQAFASGDEAEFKKIGVMSPQQIERDYQAMRAKEPAQDAALMKNPALTPGARTQTFKTNPKGVPLRERDVVEGGPFSYGAKKPRKGSVADLAAQKRKEQERDKQPAEPRDHMVGVARVKKGVAEGSGVTKLNDYDTWLDQVDSLGAEKHMQKNQTLIVAQSWDGEKVGEFDTRANQGWVMSQDISEDIEQYIEELNRAGYEVITETAQLCPECGGPAFADQVLAEKKDACYSKVKSRYKVWPSAYASGALVRCRKVGAKNWGNKSKK